ncbi:MAG: methionine--tRNA ligase [Lentisphaeria bacterium]|nr:methionine--tRNA ligase [Lentisphaeria bacterium]
MNSDHFYITTPIYYVNDKPHIGHAYTTILADVLARYHRSLNEPTFFLTGTDEHGQKVQRAAAERQVPPQQHCDETVLRFQELWKRLGITNDHFVRTTYDWHKNVVRQVLQDLYDRGEIYRAEYTGWYCVGDERFFTEKDLVDGKCPECGREVSEIIESNYFFRMSKYQDWLIEYIETHPDFIQPAFRANETLGFLRKPLGDLCISRPKSRLNWGIELPFDKDFVTYVWFDALLNYVSSVGYKQDGGAFAKWWPASCQLIGKDILTTHSVYWPTMLKAMGLPLPRTIFAHGWWLTGNTKMSKSLGNVVNPMEMVDKYGVDAFRYFLLAEMTLGNDANFTEDAFVARYNSDLANDLGNLLSRVLKMVLRSGGVIPAPGERQDDDRELLDAAAAAITGMEAAIRDMKIDQGLDAVLQSIRAGNRYLEKTAPWTLAKKGETARLNTVLHTAATAIYQAAVLLMPVMPEKMTELGQALGFDGGAFAALRIADLRQGGDVMTGRQVSDTTGLFPRIQVEAAAEPVKPAAGDKAAKAAKPAKAPEPAAPAPAVAEDGLISIDDFFRTQLRTAKVLAAEKVEKSDKLLKLQIDLGTEQRQIVAGIAQSYTAESLVGRTIVVVANLKPAKLRGIESQGMLLAAKTGNKLQLVTVDGDAEPGASVG